MAAAAGREETRSDRDRADPEAPPQSAGPTARTAAAHAHPPSGSSTKARARPKRTVPVVLTAAVELASSSACLTARRVTTAIQRARKVRPARAAPCPAPLGPATGLLCQGHLRQDICMDGAHLVRAKVRVNPNPSPKPNP